ncbi:MAG: hypothetical protein J0M34_08760 [Alphaproteobacteria bacterium]|nr:hypothetical protein [Alphaproteobacteria bacterium]
MEYPKDWRDFPNEIQKQTIETAWQTARQSPAFQEIVQRYPNTQVEQLANQLFEGLIQKFAIDFQAYCLQQELCDLPLSDDNDTRETVNTGIAQQKLLRQSTRTDIDTLVYNICNELKDGIGKVDAKKVAHITIRTAVRDAFKVATGYTASVHQDLFDYNPAIFR